jgi:hypothetical protein
MNGGCVSTGDSLVTHKTSPRRATAALHTRPDYMSFMWHLPRTFAYWDDYHNHHLASPGAAEMCRDDYDSRRAILVHHDHTLLPKPVARRTGTGL